MFIGSQPLKQDFTFGTVLGWEIRRGGSRETQKWSPELAFPKLCAKSTFCRSKLSFLVDKRELMMSVLRHWEGRHMVTR